MRIKYGQWESIKVNKNQLRDWCESINVNENQSRSMRIKQDQWKLHIWSTCIQIKISFQVENTLKELNLIE